MLVVASLTDEQIIMMQSIEKGEVNVQTMVADETGVEPVLCEMTWAWITKQ